MEVSHIRSSEVSFVQYDIDKGNTDNENDIIKAKTNQSADVYENEHYGNNALWLFSNDNKFRRKIQMIVTHKYFTYAVNILIIVNSIFLIFETINSLKDVSKYSNIIFTILFAIECLMKIIAYGFILDNHTYLRDPWNWLDFIVVITSLLTLLPGIAANLLALRTFRLIRPLKSISILPTMRIFISTLISSMVDLSIIYLMMFFFLMIFAILGLSLWSERFYYRCRTVLTPINSSLPIDPDYANVLCGGSIKCKSEEYCINSKTFYPHLISDEAFYNESNNAALNWGLTKFDNILESLFVVFLTTTCEGWAEIMKMYMDGYNYWCSFIYFILCVVINYYFMFNLSVASLLYNFETAKRIETWGQKRTKKKSDNESLRNALSALNTKEANARTLYRLKYIPIKNVSSKASVSANICSCIKITHCFEYLLPQSEYHLKFKFGFYCYRFYKQPITQYFFYFCIFVNSLLLTLDRINSSEEEVLIIEIFNIVLVCIFVFEIILLMFSVGMYKFIRSWWNIWDTLVVFVSFGEIIIRKATNSESNSSVVSIFRMLRIFRIFKLFRTWQNFQVIMNSLSETLIRMIDYLIIFLLFIYMYSLLGYSFFHDAMKELDFNFDSFISSLISVFRIVIGDHWQDIFYECHKATEFNNVPTYIFFITLIFFGQITMLNIFLSYLFDNFQRSKKHFEKNIIVKNYIHNIILFCSTEHEFQLYSPRIQRNKTEVKNQSNIKSLGKYLQKILEKQIILEGEFVLKNKLKIDYATGKTIDNEAFFNSLKDHESDTLKDYQIKVLFFEKNYKKNKKTKEDRQIDFEDEFHLLKVKYYKPPRKIKEGITKKTSIIDEIKENIHDDSSDDEESSKLKRTNSAPQIKPLFKETHPKKKEKLKKVYSNKLLKVEKQPTLSEEENIDRRQIESSENLRPIKKDKKCDISISSSSDNEESNTEEKEINQDNRDDSILIEPDNITIHSDHQNQSKSCSRSRNSIKDQMKIYQKASTHKSSHHANKLLQTKTYFQKEPTHKPSLVNKRTSIHSETEMNISTVIEKVPDIDKHPTIKEKLISFKEKIIPIITHMKNSSLFIFHKNWKIRKLVRKLVEHSYFNYTIFGLIICNCIIMCFDNPWLDPNSTAKPAIFWLNRIFNIFFIIEGFLKIVSDNFIFKEKEQINNFTSLQKILDNRELPRHKDSTNSIEVVSLSSSSLTSANVSWSKMNLAAKEQMVAKANQIISSRKAYLLDPVNILDFICIILSIVDMSISQNLAYLRVLRVFRAIKPIRLLTKSENLNIMINSLIKSIPALGNVFLLCFLFIFIFGLLGVSLFKKNLQYYCTNINIVTKEECLKAGEHWYENPNNFTNFAMSLKTNFLIMLADDWGDMMAFAGHKLEHRWVYWYYIIYVIVGYLIILNVIVAVLIQNFKFLKEREKQYKTLTIPEKEWIHLQKVILQRRPTIKDNYETNNKYQEWINDALQSTWFNNTILILTGLSIIVLIIQYNGASKGYHIMLDVFSYLLIIIFNVEISVKLFMWKKQFFFSYWNVLDLGIMIVGDIEILLNILTYADVGNMHTLSILPITLRAFRFLKALRELPSFSNFHSLIDTLMYVFPTIANVGILVFLIILIYANIGMNVFGTLPLRNVINDNVNFRNFVSTSILLFQIATKDNVGEFLHEMSYHNCTEPTSAEYQQDSYCFQYNIQCYDSDLVNYTSMNEMNMFFCGSDFSYFYILSFVLIIPLFIMNLCIVMVIEGFSESMKNNEGLLTRDYMKQFLSVWMKYDTECKRMIKPYEFALLIKEIQPAVGINYDGSKETMNLLSNRQRSKYEAYRELILLMNEQQEQMDNKSNEEDQLNNNEKKGKGIVMKKGNAYVFKDGFYLSHDLKNYTNDLEIMVLCNKFQISPIEITKEDSVKARRASIANLDNTNVLAKDYYIHYIDICLALSRFAICKMMQVNLSKLRLNVVGSYTQKLWLSKFSDDKMVINSFFEAKKHREKISTILATRILYGKLLKKQLYDARNRIIQKKNDILIEEEEENQRRILEEIGSIINDLEIVIPDNKEPTTLEIAERNIDHMFKNDGIRNSKRKHTGTIDNMNYFFNMKQASHDAVKIQNRLEILKKKIPQTPNEFYLEKEITFTED